MGSVIKPTDEIPQGFPVLMRFARKTYSLAIHDALKENGFEDLPKNGVYVLMGITKYGLSMTDLISQLGLAKQAASLLVETLVSRDYIVSKRIVNDRRQVEISPTERGEAAVEVIKNVIEQINSELVSEVGAENVQTAKYVLAVIIDINDRRHGLP